MAEAQMTRVTKGMISAAMSNLASIWEIAHEAESRPAASLQYHARSASNSLSVLNKASEPLPEWLVRNQKYLTAMGWRFQ